MKKFLGPILVSIFFMASGMVFEALQPTRSSISTQSATSQANTIQNSAAETNTINAVSNISTSTSSSSASSSTGSTTTNRTTTPRSTTNNTRALAATPRVVETQAPTPQDRQGAEILRILLGKQGFTDVQLNTRQYDETLLLQVLGVFDGYVDNTARLDQKMTRGQAAKIIDRLFGFSLINATRDTFVDVPSSHMYARNINALYHAGVTHGCTASPLKFCPDQEITRRQFAILVSNALTIYFHYGGRIGATQYYNDVNPNDMGYAEIQHLTALGITNGCRSGYFCPEEKLSRGQAVAIIARTLLHDPVDVNSSL